MVLSNRFVHIYYSIIFLVFGVTFSGYSQCNFTNGPIGEICKNAYYICGNQLDGYIGKLIEKNSTDTIWPGTPAPNQGVCNSAGTFNNSTWFSFTACAPTVHIKIKFRNCVHPTGNIPETGIQSGLYTQCKKSSSVACDEKTGNTSGELDLKYNAFIPGELVYFVLDGYATSVCEFEVEVVEGIDTTPVLPPDQSLLEDGYITGPDVIECDQKNIPFEYNLTLPECQIANNISCSSQTQFNPSDSVCFVWKVSPLDGRFFENQDSTGRIMNISFTKPGVYTISADTYFHPFYGGSCANAACGDIVSWQVLVKGPDTLINPVEILCPGDFREFCGHIITTDSLVYCSADSCNVIQQSFKVERSNLNLLGTQYICTGGGFEFQGIGYTNPGNYEVVDVSDCSLVHRFNVEVINLALSIESDTSELNCNIRDILLRASGNTNGPIPLVYTWRDTNNNQLGSTEDLSVSKSGRYIVSATYDNSGINCTTEQFIDISEDIRKPSVIAFKPTVKCTSSKDPKPVLTLISSDNLIFSEWTTPLGTKSNGLNVQLDSLNATTGLPYLFKAIGSNGCTLDTSFVIGTNFEKAVVTLTGDDLTCYQPKDTLVLTTNISVDSVRWFRTLPLPAFYGSDPSKRTHIVDLAGTYKVEVMASSSKCWSDGSIIIENKIEYPDISLQNGLKWNCNTSFIEITPTTSVGQSIRYEWKTTDGTINSDYSDLTLIAASPGSYDIHVLNTENGCERKGTLNITQETNVPNSLTVKSEDILCFGESNGVIEIIDVKGGFEPYHYFINGQKTDKLVLSDLPKGEYTLEVRDNFDCVFMTKTEIDEPESFDVSLPLELTVAFSEVTELTFTANYPDDEIMSIVWSNSKNELLGTDFMLQYSSALSDIITVEVTTENGCTATARIKINVDNELKIYFPNIFSPNGDGINDRLEIFKNTIPANLEQLSIFDRYGNKVYHVNSFKFGENTEGWDGTFNDKPAETGVYIMMIQLTDFAGNKKIITKDLTLVR